MVNIFLTGASGYIGGDVLHQLVTVHPEYTYRVLVRDASKGEAIKQAYNQVEIVQGSLEDVQLLGTEAANADVVLHLASMDHLISTRVIHRALTSKSNKEKPSFMLQIDGATNIAADELANKLYNYGDPSDAIFDDLEGVADILSVVRRNPGNDIDKYMFEVAGDTPGVKTALVVGPIIYGEGRGPVNKRSVQIPDLTKAILKRQRGLHIGKGHSRWGNVHIRDLSDLFARLVEDAVAKGGSEEAWNTNGIYLTGVEELSFAEISQHIATEACRQGLMPTDKVDPVSGDEGNSLLPEGTTLFGTNARSRARRGKEVLGWNPSHEDLAVEIRRVVTQEKYGLGLA